MTVCRRQLIAEYTHRRKQFQVERLTIATYRRYEHLLDDSLFRRNKMDFLRFPGSSEKKRSQLMLVYTSVIIIRNMQLIYTCQEVSETQWIIWRFDAWINLISVFDVCIHVRVNFDSQYLRHLNMNRSRDWKNADNAPC